MLSLFSIEALVIAGRPLLITLPLTIVFVGFMITSSYLDPMEFWVEAPILEIILFIVAIFVFVGLAYYIGGKKILKSDMAEEAKMNRIGLRELAHRQTYSSSYVYGDAVHEEEARRADSE